MNVQCTLRHVRLTIVTVEVFHILSVCVYSLSHPACSAYEPYYFVICSLFGCTLFFTLIHKRHYLLGKKVVGHKMCVLIVSITLDRSIFHSEKN